MFFEFFVEVSEGDVGILLCFWLDIAITKRTGLGTARLYVVFLWGLGAGGAVRGAGGMRVVRNWFLFYLDSFLPG